MCLLLKTRHSSGSECAQCASILYVTILNKNAIQCIGAEQWNTKSNQ